MKKRINIVEEDEEEDEDSCYKDLSSGDEESPEDLLASVTTVVKMDNNGATKSHAKGSYAQMYKNSKKSNDNIQQQPKSTSNTSSSRGQNNITANPRICLVNDSLVSLSAIKRTNMNSYPQRYQADLTCSYSISESSISAEEPHKHPGCHLEEDEEDTDEYDHDDNGSIQDKQEEALDQHYKEQLEEEEGYSQHEEYDEEEEDLEDEEEETQEGDYDQEEEEENDLRTTNLTSVRDSSRSSFNTRSSSIRSIAEGDLMSHSIQQPQHSVADEEIESDIEELEETLGEEKDQVVDEEIDEAVLPPSSRSSMRNSMFKQSLSGSKLVSAAEESQSLTNTIKTEIDNEDFEEDEEGDEYKDLEELEEEQDENEYSNEEIQNSVEIRNVHRSEKEEIPNNTAVVVTTNNKSTCNAENQQKPQQQQLEMKDNILQSISLFKQYKATQQVSQSVVGLDHHHQQQQRSSSSSTRKLKPIIDHEPLRVSKVLELPKPNINLNESISENDVDKIKKQNHLLRMQLLEQQRMLDEGKVVLQERIEQEIEKAKSQALKEFLQSSNNKKQQVVSPEPTTTTNATASAVERKTLRDIKKQSESSTTTTSNTAADKTSGVESTISIRVKESPRPSIPTVKVVQKKEVIEILPDEFENTTDMKKQMEMRNKNYLEVRKQKFEKIEESKKKEKQQPIPKTAEAKTAENGMILKNMKQPNKTNKLLIKNALIHLTLAGEVNKKEREDVFEAMKEYEDTCQLVLLVREVTVPAFRALYAVVTDGVNANVGSSTSTTDSHKTDNSSTRSDSPEKRPDQILVKKIIGKGPKFLTEDTIDVFCRYDSGGKKLSKLASRTFGVTTDVVVLKSAANKKIKR